MLAWTKFPHSLVTTWDLQMFRNLIILFFLKLTFFYLLILYAYVDFKLFKKIKNQKMNSGFMSSW